MQCMDGENTLDIQKNEAVLRISLLGTQVNQEAVNFIKSKVPLEPSSKEEFAFEIAYDLPKEAKSLTQLMQDTTDKRSRLDLALSLRALLLKSRFTFPFIHPENIFLVSSDFIFIHRGLEKILVPMEEDEALFLAQAKALILFILNPKISYNSLVLGENSLKDKLSQKLGSSQTLENLFEILNIESQKEQLKEKQIYAKIPKGRYNFFKYVGSLALIAAIILGVFTFIEQRNTLPKEKAIVTAQSHFITNLYDKVQEDLKNYQPKQLPKEARFVLASASVNLANLTPSQKQAVLNNISITTDDNTLNYWIYQGRGEFEEALNLAKNIGDDQLTLLAYTDLYQATKLNTSMNGDEKQKKLDEYQKAITELSKGLGK